MIVALIAWILKSMFLLGLLHFCVPVLINAVTMNSWAKLPLMVIAGILAGILMTWMHYVPYLLVFVWLSLAGHTLALMFKPKFEEKHGVRLKKPVFYVSTYAYIVLACLSAYFFQAEIVSTSDSSVPVPLWQWIF